MRKMRSIDALFPKTRQEILSATMLHPEKWWYLSDLARHLGVSPSSLQRELAALVRAGILQRKTEGREVYYRAHPDCPILDDLQGIMLKTVGLTNVLAAALGPHEKAVVCAFVYGSVARMEEVSESDVDLIIISEQGLSLFAPLLRRAEDKLGRPVNATVYHPQEIASKLKTKDHFLQSVLRAEKLFIVGDEDVLAGASK